MPNLVQVQTVRDRLLALYLMPESSQWYKELVPDLVLLGVICLESFMYVNDFYV